MANDIELLNKAVVPYQAPYDPQTWGMERPTSTKFKPEQRLGVAGVNIVGGYISPTDKDAALQGRQRYLTFSEMIANIAIIATAVYYFSSLVGKAEWSVEPADDDNPAAVKVAEFVEDCMHDMETPFDRIMRRACMYTFYGFSIQEWIAKPRDDGFIGMLNIEPRPQVTIERWDCTELGVLNGVFQRTPVGGQILYMPRNKLIYLTDDTVNASPDGIGLLRHCVKAALSLSRMEDLEVWGFETDLRGVPKVVAPLAELDKMVANAEITKAQKQQILAGAQQFAANHVKGASNGFVMDSATYIDEQSGSISNVPKWSIDLLKSDGGSHADIGAAINRKQIEISRVLGVEHLMLGGSSRGGGGGGSMALSQTAIQRTYLMVNGALMALGSAFTSDFIKPLMTLNNHPKELWPKLKPAEISYRTIEEVTTALQAMAAAGAPMMPDDPAVGEVRDLLGLSRPTVDNELAAMLGNVAITDPPAPKNPAPTGKPAQGAKPANSNARQQKPNPAAAATRSRISQLMSQISD